MTKLERLFDLNKVKVLDFITIEPEEYHNHYYGVDEEHDEEFMQEWEQNARDAHIEKVHAQLKNKKLMLGGMQSMLPKGLPQLMDEVTPNHSKQRKKLALGSSNSPSLGNSKADNSRRAHRN